MPRRVRNPRGVSRALGVSTATTEEEEKEKGPEGLAGAHLADWAGEDPNLRRQVFRRRDFLRFGPLAVLRHLWIQLTVLASMFAICAGVLMYYQGLDPLTALLASVSTITTIGIWTPTGGLQSLPDSEKVALILLFLASVGAAASLVQSAVTQMVNKQNWTEEVLRKEVARMQDHLILMGYAHLGKYVAQKLDELGVPYVVIVRAELDLAKLRGEGVPAFGASATEFHRALEEVGLRRATTMICTYEDDATNLMAILYAKKVKPDLRVITVVHDRELIGSATLAGADVVLPMANLMGDLLGLSAVSKEVAGVVLSSKMPGRYVAEFVVPRGRSYTIGQLNAIAPVLMVLQDGKTLSTPADSYVLQSGSTIFALTRPDSLRRLRETFGAVGLVQKSGTPGSSPATASSAEGLSRQ